MLNRLIAQNLPEQEMAALIKKAVAYVFNHVPVGDVFIFGSAARREMKSTSDLDIAVIVPNEDLIKSTRKSLVSLCSYLEGLPVDLVVYDKTYFEEKSQIGGLPFVIREEGQKLNRSDYVT